MVTMTTSSLKPILLKPKRLLWSSLSKCLQILLQRLKINQKMSKAVLRQVPFRTKLLTQRSRLTFQRLLSPQKLRNSSLMMQRKLKQS